MSSAGLQTGAPGKPVLGLLGWETGVPNDRSSLLGREAGAAQRGSKPVLGLLGW